MKDRLYCLDSSALLCLIENEQGADRVEDVLRQKKTIIPWVCLMEVRYISIREQGLSVANKRYALLKTLPSELLWQENESVLFKAARFKAQYPLSFADAIIAAHAADKAAVLLHKDPEYQALAEELDLEALVFRK